MYSDDSTDGFITQNANDYNWILVGKASLRMGTKARPFARNSQAEIFRKRKEETPESQKVKVFAKAGVSNRITYRKYVDLSGAGNGI